MKGSNIDPDKKKKLPTFQTFVSQGRINKIRLSSLAFPGLRDDAVKIFSLHHKMDEQNELIGFRKECWILGNYEVQDFRQTEQLGGSDIMFFRYLGLVGWSLEQPPYKDRGTTYFGHVHK